MNNEHIEYEESSPTVEIALPAEGGEKKRKRGKLLGRIGICLAVMALIGGVAAWFFSSFVNIGGQWISVGTERLDLRGLNITDCSELARCRKLVHLDLRDNDVASDSFDELREALPECEIIWDVPLGGITIESSSPQVDLSGIPVTSDELARAIGYLTGLERLTLTGCGLEADALFDLRDANQGVEMIWEMELGGVGFLSTDTELVLSGVGIEDVSALARMTQLVSLDLSGNGLKDLSPLAGLTGLRSLDLSDDYVKDLSPLSGLTGLEELYLVNVGASDISALAGCTRLTRLNLFDNLVADVSPLEGMTAITWLNLNNNNKITDPSALGGMSELEWLNISSNKLGSVAPLCKLGKLGDLRVVNCGLSAEERKQLSNALTDRKINF